MVLDFVGSAPTIALGAAVAKAGMDLVVVGAAAGQFTWNFYALPYEVSLTTSFWGTLPELHEVIALARRAWSRRTSSASRLSRRCTRTS